jgi:membrane protein implicated in regulation of membrane protease activity
MMGMAIGVGVATVALGLGATVFLFVFVLLVMWLIFSLWRTTEEEDEEIRGWTGEDELEGCTFIDGGEEK